MPAAAVESAIEVAAADNDPNPQNLKIFVKLQRFGAKLISKPGIF